MLPMSPKALASASVALSGILWGLFWIPMRLLGEAGLPPGWATVLIYAVAALALGPFALRRRAELAAGGMAAGVTGVMTGGGFALYAMALLLTDVARTILLFYLTPVWGALLGRLILGERITALRMAALVSGILGLLVVFRADEQIPLPQNAGDLFALAAGVIWAYGSLRLYVTGSALSAPSSVFLFFAAGLGFCLAVALPLEGIAPVLDGSRLAGAAPLVALTVGLAVLPATFLTLWGAARLSAARVGILLMGEIAVGVTSAAILTDEPFGAREIVGTVLILTAGLLEISGRDKPAPAATGPSAG